MAHTDAQFVKGVVDWAGMPRDGRPEVWGVAVGEKSPCWLGLETRGVPGHGSLAREEGAVPRLVEALARLRSLEREIRRLRATLLDSLEAREGEAFANRGELSRRLERLEEQLGRVMALAGENQRLLSGMERRLAQAPPSGAGEAPDTATARDEPSGEGGEEQEEAAGDAASEPRQLYEASLQQFRRGSYQTARSGLEEFLSSFPDHDLAPDARFYVAESYAEADEVEQALEAYSRVVELFPNSRRAASALYKSGRLELERGNVEDARVFFSRVVNGYPDSDEAGLARDQLRELDGGG